MHEKIRVPERRRSRLHREMQHPFNKKTSSQDYRYSSNFVRSGHHDKRLTSLLNEVETLLHKT